MARKTLVGFYGKYSQAVIGAQVITGTLTAGALYIAKTIGASSALPVGLEAGYVFYADGTEDISASDDVVLPVTFNDLCDIQSWSLDFSKAEIDVTALCDDQNVYLAGRGDVSGSVEGVYKIGVTDVDGGFANSFFDIVRQDGDGGAVTIDKIDDSSIVAILYKQKDKSVGETEQFYISSVTNTTFSDSVTGSDPQAFSSSFRIAPSDDLKFQLVSVKR